jgi:hypothetical protein
LRAPRIAASGFLSGLLAACLVCVLGGPGGAWLALRNERRRIDAHDDDLEQLRQRIARREGAAGRAVVQARQQTEQEEIERIVASQRNGKGKAPPAHNADEPDLPDWVRGVLAGWQNPGSRS